MIQVFQVKILEEMSNIIMLSLLLQNKYDFFFLLGNFHLTLFSS